MTTAKENALKLEALGREYPGMLKMHGRLSEDEALNFAQKMINGGVQEVFENTDSAMIDYAERHLADGRKVNILVWGRDHVMVAIPGARKHRPRPGSSVRTKSGGKVFWWLLGIVLFIVLSRLACTSGDSSRSTQRTHTTANIVIVSVDRANVREEPSLSARVVASASKGTQMRQLRLDGEWHYVEFETRVGRQRGWIHRSVVTLTTIDS